MEKTPNAGRQSSGNRLSQERVLALAASIQGSRSEAAEVKAKHGTGHDHAYMAGCLRELLAQIVTEAAGGRAGALVRLAFEAPADTAPAVMAEYVEALASHDWTSQFSDSREIRKRGAEQRQTLDCVRPRLDPRGEVWNLYAPHDFQVREVRS